MDGYMRPDVAKRIRETEQYRNEENEIILSIINKLVKFESVTPSEDMKHGIDSKISLICNENARRVIINPYFWEKDHAIMIRCSTSKSMYSEYQKLIDGTSMSKYYLYRWLGPESVHTKKCHAWIFFDIERLKFTYEFISAPLQYFRDGGSYITVKVSDMARSGCIVDCNDVVRNYLFSLL
jgi:hypothetical protein